MDATEKDAQKLESLHADELPESMRSLSLPQKKVYLETKRTERTKVQKQIRDVDLKMQPYITQELKKQGVTNTLDQVMLDAVTKQATAKGFVFWHTMLKNMTDEK